MGGCTFERKAPFATTSFKKVGGVFSRVGLFLGDYGTHIKIFIHLWVIPIHPNPLAN